MDFINALLICAGLFNLGWLILFLRSYFRGVNKKIANVFILTVIAAFLWILAMFFYRFSQNDETILLLCRFLYASAALIPVTLLYFAYFFPTGANALSRLKFILILLPAVALIYLTLFTDTIVYNAYAVKGGEHFIVWGKFYWLYVIYIPAYFSWSLQILFKRYRENTGIVRAQALYILVGISISSFIAMISNLILPSFSYFKLNWLGQAATIIWVSLTIYPIVRYRLADIRIILRKIFTYFLSGAFVYGIFYFLVWLYGRVFGGVFNTYSYISGLFIAAIFVASFLQFNKFIQQFFNKYLFSSLYNYQKTIANLADDLTDSIDLDKIVDSIVKIIKQSMQLERAGVLLINERDGKIQYKIGKVVGFNESNGISLVQDNFLTRYLQKIQKPLVGEEMTLLAKNSDNAEERQSFSQLSESMKHIEASLCLPMINSNRLIGIIVLGSKISGDAYTKEDLDLLNTLSKQASIAVDNARLYKEVQEFNSTLQQKVDEQTKEIKRALDVETEANKELRQIDLEKTQFMQATSHHLRTPLTSMIGYADLALGGSFGKLSAKQKEIFSRIGVSGKILERMINEFMDVSSISLGKKVSTFESGVEFEDILDSAVKDIQDTMAGDARKATGWDIYFKVEKPTEKLPQINADPLKLKMALFNIFNNAIKYTDTGGVSVKIKVEDEKIKIEVKDTGIGITEEELETIFTRTYSQSKRAHHTNPFGRGIGLFFAANVVKEHGGKIWAESEGEGKGSVFYIELPVGENKE